MKVCGQLFINMFSAIGVVVASGNTGSLLAECGIIEWNSQDIWNTYGWDMSFAHNGWVHHGSQVCDTHITQPIINLRKFLWNSTPSIEYNGLKHSKAFILTALEDVVFIGLIQRTALPIVAKLLPKQCGDILNHKVTRVVISSVIFALAHSDNAEYSPLGIMPQFTFGLISVTVAELDDSLLIPIISHFGYDLILRLGRSPALA